MYCAIVIGHNRVTWCAKYQIYHAHLYNSGGH